MNLSRQLFRSTVRFSRAQNRFQSSAAMGLNRQESFDSMMSHRMSATPVEDLNADPRCTVCGQDEGTCHICELGFAPIDTTNK